MYPPMTCQSGGSSFDAFQDYGDNLIYPVHITGQDKMKMIVHNRESYDVHLAGKQMCHLGYDVHHARLCTHGSARLLKRGKTKPSRTFAVRQRSKKKAAPCRGRPQIRHNAVMPHNLTPQPTSHSKLSIPPR